MATACHETAARRGYTAEWFGHYDHGTLHILAAPDADLDGTFKAWDCDAGEFIRVNGWLFSFETEE